MQTFNRDDFRHIYLLSGTAPEIYGSGHLARSSYIQTALSDFRIDLISVLSAPEEFWQKEGADFLCRLQTNASGGSSIVLMDARDLDPAPILPFAPVLALDNFSSHRTSRSQQESGLSRVVHSSGSGKNYPCYYYDVLLPGCNLESSVRRYLGPAGIQTTDSAIKQAVKIDSAGNGPESIAASSRAEARPVEMLFYAGAPGFISPVLLETLDRLFQTSFRSYIRVGGTAPMTGIDYRQRLTDSQFHTLLHSADFFLGYYGLSLYQAAASGCFVWGLLIDQKYHDSLIRSWSEQGGGPILRSVAETNPATGQNSGPRIEIWQESESSKRRHGAHRHALSDLIQAQQGWTLPSGSLLEGQTCLRAALRSLLRAIN